MTSIRKIKKELNKTNSKKITVINRIMLKSGTVENIGGITFGLVEILKKKHVRHLYRLEIIQILHVLSIDVYME